MLGIETEQNRIFGLDFLRAIAIFLVVHGHGAFLLNDTLLFCDSICIHNAGARSTGSWRFA